MAATVRNLETVAVFTLKKMRLSIATLPRFIEKLVFVTHLPCVQCAKRLINLGNVITVYYGQDYRIKDSVDLLRSVGIQVEQLKNHDCTIEG